jgi:hypothetical protein
VSPAPATTTTVATTSSVPPPTTTAAPPPAVTHTETAALPPPAKKKTIERPKPVEPVVPVSPPVSIRAYIDGEGSDSAVNDQAISDAKRHLSGTRSVAVRGNNAEQVKELSDRLKREGIAVSDSADTVISFDGSVERLGRGKKRRSAQATVTKNGRMVFRYEMPPEEYRVGDTPAEAFARIFTDAIH